MRRAGAAGYADLRETARPVPAGPCALREGRDFATQQELAQALSTMPPTDREQPPGSAICGALMRLVQMTVRDMQMHERTGQLPGGLPYSSLPAWRVQLYRAWWQEPAPWRRTVS